MTIHERKRCIAEVICLANASCTVAVSVVVPVSRMAHGAAALIP